MNIQTWLHLTLARAESIAVIASAVATIVAAWFVALQISHMKRSREVEAFLRIVEAGNREPVSSCSTWVKYEMPENMDYQKARGDRSVWDKIGHVVHHFEMIGILVEREYISEDLIYDQMGSWIAGTWAKVQTLINVHRTSSSSPDYAENFEVLAASYETWASANLSKVEKRARIAGQAARKYYKPDR